MTEVTKNSTFLNPRNFFLLGLITIVIGLSLSKPLISLGQIILFLTWMIDGKIKDRLIRFYQNKTAVFISSIYLLTLLGLIYTSNFDYAIGDVRRKAALFGLPFLIAGFKPITPKEWKLIFKVYVIGVLFASFWSVIVFLGGLEKTIIDVREYSRFTSHIRFGLEICFAIFGSIYFFFSEKERKNKLIWLIIIIWLIGFMYLISLFTGVIVLAITSVILSIYLSLSSSKRWIKYGAIFCFFTLVTLASVFIKNTFNNFYDCKNVTPLAAKEHTNLGEPYYHDNSSAHKNEKENGYYTYKNIAWQEIENTWNKRSNLSFKGKDLKEQDLSTTLIRFLTSKGVYKNQETINQLTDKEIEAIEMGVANSKYLEMNNVEIRINKILWEINNYQNGLNYNGHSVIMRWEYWKTAFKIFKQNPLIGVGTGDLQDAFNTQYDADNSLLTPNHRLRAHNQFITYGVSFGILGLVYFLLFLFVPFIRNKGYKDFFYLAFFSIILLSLISEDTLETQVAINFFAVFNTILLLKKKD